MLCYRFQQPCSEGWMPTPPLHPPMWMGGQSQGWEPPPFSQFTSNDPFNGSQTMQGESSGGGDPDTKDDLFCSNVWPPGFFGGGGTRCPRDAILDHVHIFRICSCIFRILCSFFKSYTYLVFYLLFRTCIFHFFWNAWITILQNKGHFLGGGIPTYPKKKSDKMEMIQFMFF